MLVTVCVCCVCALCERRKQEFVWQLLFFINENCITFLDLLIT